MEVQYAKLSAKHQEFGFGNKTNILTWILMLARTVSLVVLDEKFQILINY